MSELVLTTEGETHVIVKRRFEAPPEAVYRAHFDPSLIQQWCVGPEGRTMPVCVNEGKPGGKIRPATRPSVHVSIDVPDLEAGLRFYGDVFGFMETARPFPTMAILDANNVTVCMHQKEGGSQSSSTGTERRRYERHWTPVHLDLHVADFDGVLNAVRAQGGAIENELRTQGPRPAAFCSDPFGNGFCVIAERVG